MNKKYYKLKVFERAEKQKMPHIQLGQANGNLNKGRKGFTRTLKEGRDWIISPEKESLWSRAWTQKVVRWTSNEECGGQARWQPGEEFLASDSDPTGEDLRTNKAAGEQRGFCSTGWSEVRATRNYGSWELTKIRSGRAEYKSLRTQMTT